ncbi:MAG TPA: metallophosphoesterase family protein [Oligoflexia bacterium]|nr:metallophosphoesterase family protein [Oligoflexia bacterium]HMP47067.1 metallophosphoesterase family protein [Oligoflexia bacterium]
MLEIIETSGERELVIGDIHGCAEELSVLLTFLREKIKITQNDLVVFLGDYIDRGPDSRRVVDLLVQFKHDFPVTRFLRGNHEDMLMDFLGFGGSLGHAFLYNGGLETIQSYGISVFSPPGEMMRLMPESHFKFFSSLDSIVSLKSHLLVHAGLNPSNDLFSQKAEDVYWIREAFLDSEFEFGKTVVFGHTPHREVFDHRPFKLGIDTGVVFGNKLSCFDINSNSLYQVRRGTMVVDVSNLPEIA